jgi:hypothetical protein
MIRGRFTRLRLISLVTLWVILNPALSRALEVEMPTCEMIKSEMAQGRSLEQAIINIVNSNAKEEKPLFEATMMTLIRDAIRVCHHNGTRVVQAAYKGGVPISILFEAVVRAGGDRETVQQAILQAGADPSEVKRAKAKAPLAGSGKPPLSIFREGSAPIGSGLDSLSDHPP